MSITFQILGAAGRDNALLVQVDTGQSIERLLFDCGEACLSDLTFSDVQAIDHLFFSHLHMDHIGGFDSFFRANFNRHTKPNHIWGPPETARILQHRFQGFLWNLHEQMSGAWRVTDIHPAEVCTTRFELQEAFAVPHDEGCQPIGRHLCEGAGFIVDTITMDHRTPTLAYVVREKTRRNIDPARLKTMGLRPGPWMKQLKDASQTADAVMTIDDVRYAVTDLQRELIVETPGDSIAYLTDFLLDEPATERLVAALRGCRVVVCEGQYRHADIGLAHKHFHMTTVLSATLARRAQVEELVLFHLSDRYDREVWLEMLQEARQIFPKTRYATHWNLELAAGSGAAAEIGE